MALLCFVLALVGCSTRKSVSSSPVIDEASVEILKSSPSVSADYSCISGNVRLTVDIEGKAISARGTMRIKKNEGVQVGITALGLVEVGCLEFLPTCLRVINKIEKEYSEVSYSDVDFLQRTGIDYALLESVLMNRVFSPDGTPVTAMLGDIDASSSGDTAIVTIPEYKGLVYSFRFDKATTNLVQSEGLYKNGTKVVCSYQDFEKIGGADFPHIMTLVMDGGEKRVSLKFELSNISSAEFNFSPRKVSSGYEKLDASGFLKSLGNF
jgi:hypothetical protein